MHFWIDKRSQCTYTGRHRVPSSLSAGRARGRVCVDAALGARKGMAAPVHRFAAVDCPSRRPHRTHRHYTPPPLPTVQARRQEDTMYVELGSEPPQPTIASLAAARSVTPDTLLRTAALGLQHTPMVAPHLKFGMLVSFVIATGFLAGVKYYFDRVVREPGGSEIGMVFAAVACVCVLGCALTVCRSKPPPLVPPERVSSTAQRDRPPPPETTDDISLGALLPPERGVNAGPIIESPEAPPPYKIAVLMPPREVAPPSYTELS